MKIAVVQHTLRPTLADDAEVLLLAATMAHVQGATWVVIPDTSSVRSSSSPGELTAALARGVPDVRVLVASCAGEPWCLTPDDPAAPGRTVVIAGDACFTPAVLADVRAVRPGVVVLAPASESELQAEAAVEFGMALSTTLAPLVIIAEPDGNELGEPGHDGSAIIHLGEVLAEGFCPDELLTGDVEVPLVRLEHREELPPVPHVLAQRVAAHQGARLPVDYPADPH